jgi:nitrogen fixation/metabolism regulation signal transduction histidine kinase
MKVFRKLSLKVRQTFMVWLCLCGALLLGTCGFALFQLITGPIPLRRSNETEVLCIGFGIAAFLFVASFVAAAALSAWIQRLIARPMLDLMRTADSVSGDKPGAKRCRDNDELSALIDEFHLMLGQIRAQDAALHEARVQLEARVAERTRELSAEVLERQRAEVMLRQQVERMSLINQITRAVAERVDLDNPCRC